MEQMIVKQTMSTKQIRIRFLSMAALLALSFLSIGIGAKGFEIRNLLDVTSEEWALAMLSRIPRLLSILITGASLSIAGYIMQAITRNKFVSPSTAGTMEWCKFGVMLALVFYANASSTTKLVAAFFSALGGSLLFIFLLNTAKIKEAVMVPLLGMMLGSVVSAVTTYFAFQYDIIQNISSWLLGSFSLVLKGKYEMLYLGIPFLLLGYFYADKFTISGMGEDVAKNLGVNHKVVVLIGLSIVSLITTTVVVTIGSIPFVGLIIPNMVSMIYGDSVKKNLFDTALIGALFLLACDVIGRIVIFPYEISVSVIMSVVGSGLFLVLLIRRNKHA